MRTLFFYMILVYVLLPTVLVFLLGGTVLELPSPLPLIIFGSGAAFCVRGVYHKSSELKRLASILKTHTQCDRLSDRDFNFMLRALVRYCPISRIRQNLWKLLTSYSDIDRFLLRANDLMREIRMDETGRQYLKAEIEELKEMTLKHHLRSLSSHLPVGDREKMMRGFLTIVREQLPITLWFHGSDDLKRFVQDDLNKSFETMEPHEKRYIRHHLDFGIKAYLSDMSQIPASDYSRVQNDYDTVLRVLRPEAQGAHKIIA